MLKVRIQPIQRFPRIAPVDIAERHDILRGKIDEIRPPHAADADARDVEHIAGWHETAAENMAGDGGQRGSSSNGRRNKCSTRNSITFKHNGLQLTAKRVTRRSADATTGEDRV